MHNIKRRGKLIFQSTSSFHHQIIVEHIWKLILHLLGTAPSVLINCYSICLITRNIVPYFPALFFPTSIHFAPPGHQRLMLLNRISMYTITFSCPANHIRMIKIITRVPYAKFFVPSKSDQFCPLTLEFHSYYFLLYHSNHHRKQKDTPLHALK